MGVNMKIDFNETEILVLSGIINQYSDFLKDNNDKILDTGKIDRDTYCKIINNLKSKLFTYILILCKTNKKLRDIINKDDN